MKDEIERMDTVLEHSRLLNAGDVGGLLALYADGAVFEDPVGSGPRTGRDALRDHFERAVAANTAETPGKPVAGQDGLHALVPISSVMDYRPNGPGFAERGWLTLPAGPGPEPERLERDAVHLIRTGPDGLITESRTFWGRTDLRVPGTPPEPRPDPAAAVGEASGKAGAREYARLMNAGDVDGILAMFTDDVVFEDPVGGEPVRGLDQLRAHIAWSVACNAHETPGRVVSSVDGRWVAVPSTVVVRVPTKITFTIVGVMERADGGLTRHVRAFWGLANTKVGDGPDLTGLAHVLTAVDALRKMHNPHLKRTSPA